MPSFLPNRSRSGPVHISRLALVLLPLMFATLSSSGQQIDLGNLGKTFREKPVRVGGGVSASTVFYDGNDGQSRQPFTYFLTGSLNVNLFNQINLPFSFNFTNLGSNFGYPTLPNRLSLHPTYKWVTGHIGDVAITFSPYTLNGHMFRGVGVDLSPPGAWKFNAMYGRLQRAVEYNPENTIVPAAYERFGYGAKARYDGQDYYAGMTVFVARDDVNSLLWQPDSLQIFPQANTAMSWEGGMKILSNLTLSGEYAVSFLTRDVRAERDESSWGNRLLGNRTSTHVYRAAKADLTYQLAKNTLGVRYERIDPEYRTLGAYYFNNDYENITLQYARPFLHDKANLALSWGVQRDDLNHDKEQSSKRFVSSANVSYAPTEKLNFSLSYSGFQSYMNIRSQFDYINGQTPYDNLDTLNYTQLSQNLSANALYYFGKQETRKQTLNVNLSFQEAADKQGDVIRPGALSQFYNSGLMYTLFFVPEGVSFNAAFNTTFNRAGGEEFLTLGPMAGLKAKVFKKKMVTGFSAGYNSSFTNGSVRSRVLNLRANAGYVLAKRHNLNINSIWQRRDFAGSPIKTAFTTTLSYQFAF